MPAVQGKVKARSVILQGDAAPGGLGHDVTLTVIDDSFVMTFGEEEMLRINTLEADASQIESVLHFTKMARFEAGISAGEAGSLSVGELFVNDLSLESLHANVATLGALEVEEGVSAASLSVGSIVTGEGGFFTSGDIRISEWTIQSRVYGDEKVLAFMLNDVDLFHITGP